MDNFRKTLAYKICGYFFFVLIVIAVVFVIFVMSGTTMWHELVLMILAMGIASLAPKIIFPIFIILSVVAYVTRNKYTDGRCSIIADIGYIFMLIISVLYLFMVPSYIQQAQQEKESRYYKEYPIVTKNSCKLLNDNLPHIAELLGDNFTKEPIAEEMSKIDNMIYADAIYNLDEIVFYRNEPDSYIGKQSDYIAFKTSRNKPCDIDKKNCYIYLKKKRNVGECKFYYNKKGKVVPSEKTLEFIK